MKGLSIEFPALYYDIRFTTCIFTAKIERLKSILPHPQFIPIHIWPGTGMLGITALEYRDTSVGPYNEVAITVPLNFPPAAFLGKHSALSMMHKNIFPVYIHHLPVTTEIALGLGVHFYNYPKFLSWIDFQERHDFLEITLKEGDDLIRLNSTPFPWERKRSCILWPRDRLVNLAKRCWGNAGNWNSVPTESARRSRHSS